MYYHIRIDYYDKKLKANQTLFDYDYPSEEDVMDKIVVPYVTEQRMLFAGTFLSPDDRRHFAVFETERDIKSMVTIANKNVSPSVFFVYHNADIVGTSKYSKDITKEITQKAVDLVEERKSLEAASEPQKEKQPLLFISHASADEYIVTGLVEMLRTIGFNKKNLFCSSVPGYDIPEGEDIYDFLLGKLTNYELFVIFVLSESYYKSAACLNEMGAAWVLKANYSTLTLPGFNIPEIRGAVNPRMMAVVLDDGKRVKGNLNQLKDRLIEFFGLPETDDDTIWESDRDKFISIANASK